MKKIKAHIKEKEVIKVKIDTDFIKLDAFLKLSGEVSTGGEAKILIAKENLKVNGEKTKSRGKKLHIGDKISVLDREYEVI